MKFINSEKGVAMIIVLTICIVASIYLSSYAIWTIWDQRNLGRQQRADLAGELALSGLNRALVNLKLDADWLDGDINGQNVTLPQALNPDDFYLLYNGTNATLASGNYTVYIRYLFNNATSVFYSKRIWVKSTGTTTDAFRTLQQIINGNIVKNMNTNSTYYLLQPAMDEALTNHSLGIAGFHWGENPAISVSKTLLIKGGYSPDFSYRDCGNFVSVLEGNLTASGSANITLSGLTIE